MSELAVPTGEDLEIKEDGEGGAGGDGVERTSPPRRRRLNTDGESGKQGEEPEEEEEEAPPARKPSAQARRINALERRLAYVEATAEELANTESANVIQIAPVRFMERDSWLTATTTLLRKYAQHKLVARTRAQGMRLDIECRNSTEKAALQQEIKDFIAKDTLPVRALYKQPATKRHIARLPEGAFRAVKAQLTEAGAWPPSPPLQTQWPKGILDPTWRITSENTTIARGFQHNSKHLVLLSSTAEIDGTPLDAAKLAENMEYYLAHHIAELPFPFRFEQSGDSNRLEEGKEKGKGKGRGKGKDKGKTKAKPAPKPKPGQAGASPIGAPALAVALSGLALGGPGASSAAA